MGLPSMIRLLFSLGWGGEDLLFLLLPGCELPFRSPHFFFIMALNSTSALELMRGFVARLATMLQVVFFATVEGDEAGQSGYQWKVVRPPPA
jgi:hypothetical protein